MSAEHVPKPVKGVSLGDHYTHVITPFTKKLTKNCFNSPNAGWFDKHSPNHLNTGMD